MGTVIDHRTLAPVSVGDPIIGTIIENDHAEIVNHKTSLATAFDVTVVFVLSQVGTLQYLLSQLDGVDWLDVSRG